MADAMSEASLQGRPHILAVAFPLIGHLTPILQICCILIASTGCRVTMACYHKHVPRLSSLVPQAIQDSGYLTVLPIWSETVQGWDGGGDWDLFRSQLRVVMEQLPFSLRPLLQSFQSAEQHLALVLSDVFLSWSQDVAEQLRIPRLALHVSTPAEYQVYFHARGLMEAGILPFKAPPGRGENDIDFLIPEIPGRPPLYHRVDEIGEDEEPILISGLPPLYRRDIPTFLQIEDASDDIFSLFFEHMTKTGSQAHMLLFNTLDALDGSLLAVMKSQGIPVRPIGPLLGILEDVLAKEQRFVRVETESASKANLQNPECVQWLDAQKPRSVIYVAFGTIVTLSVPQLKELARGLLHAGQPFIWAWASDKRGQDDDAEGMQGFVRTFLEQAQGKGLVLDWAPQKLILQHPSVGAFLSHCGFNSTMESIWCGVPMLCLPVLTDQHLICKLVVEEYKIGIRLLQMNKENVVHSSQISQLIKEMLGGEVGKAMHERVQQLKVAARQCVQPVNSSRATMDAIIKLLA